MKYLISSTPTIISALAWLGEKSLAQYLGDDFKNIPWHWLFFITLAFLMGVILSDMSNNNSTIRSYLRNKFKIADIDHFVLADGIEYYEARLKFHFKKHFNEVRCSIKICQYADTKHANKEFIATQEIIRSVEPNLEHVFVVATYPKQSANPYWGLDKTKTWAGEGNHIVTLKLRTFLFTQTERFYIASIRSFSNGTEPVLLFSCKPNNENFQTC